MNSSPLASEPETHGSTSLGYRPPAEGYDEAIGPRGEPRQHWQAFFRSLADLGMHDLVRRWRDAQHLIRENGVAYNVYGDPRGISRPWQLDPIPQLIAPREAEELQTGLVQRARLFEQILHDLYGPQKLLHNRLIPPELVFANPGFLRPCHGINIPGGRYLHLYAANLGRQSDGSFCVLGDRTQAPSGAGYALENRIVMKRTLSETFRDCRVHRLALFFRSLRDTLRAIAPRNRDNPHIALLTPGPYNETYFEHAYLARYLGYTLVEGGDLTVRDNCVYLKVLGGLRPVDVLFRRLDDDFCDPLELRPDSFLGVPGLVEAVRCGNVAVANGLGSGLIEPPAFLGYLPKLCRALLGEDLKIPSVTTWWCGEPRELEYVLSRLDELVIKPAFPGSWMEPIFADDLPGRERAALVERIRARPRAYVGQQRLALSTAPVLNGDHLEPRRMVLRVYLAAEGDGFAFMPGGLTRVGSTPESMVVSMQRGGGSKDTWFLSTGAVSNFSLLPPSGLPVELTRRGEDLPSRAADNLFWLGRYAERSEGLSRLLRVLLLRLLEKEAQGDVPELPALLRALALHCECPALAADGVEHSEGLEEEVLAVVLETDRPGSLATSLLALARVAGVARDRISTDMWRVIHSLRDFGGVGSGSEWGVGSGEWGAKARSAFASRSPLPTPHSPLRATPPTASVVLESLNRTVITLAAFGGLAVESMTRGPGWRFLDMGRKLERAAHMLYLLRGTLVKQIEPESPLLEGVLDIADSSMTYRRRYLGSLRTEAVLDLLIADESNPRSLASQFVDLSSDMEHLPRPTERVGRSREERMTLAALTTIRLVEVETLAAVHDGTRPALAELLDSIRESLPRLSDTITQQYLSHLQTSRHLGK